MSHHCIKSQRDCLENKNNPVSSIQTSAPKMVAAIDMVPHWKITLNLDQRKILKKQTKKILLIHLDGCAQVLLAVKMYKYKAIPHFINHDSR